ncbi:MAG TPA: GAF domain-containing protein [Terriglobales bacterium]|nr:GAF domain-containing protein [Terriglobales bacterium]
MSGSAQPEDRIPAVNVAGAMAAREESFAAGGVSSSGGGGTLAEPELDAALQLLVERAQYITGATGTALALPQGDEMVCRASAGLSAPAVGARLQVRSGLTGESIARRQLLRCDNAESDPRVNLETCRALGIASIVVLPLLRRSGEVRGLFELFSDHPYAFEERDLIALERMADLTLTALDLAEQRQNFSASSSSSSSSAAAALPPTERETPIAAAAPRDAAAAPSIVAAAPSVVTATPSIIPAAPSEVSGDSSVVRDHELHPDEGGVEATTSAEVADATKLAASESFGGPVAESVADVEAISPQESLPAQSFIPEAMRRVQKCASCGFPVSEGRTLCLDCEKKDKDKKRDQKLEEARLQTIEAGVQASASREDAQPDVGAAQRPEGEILPPFLANAVPAEESWLANHVNLLAIVVLIVGILVAVVVFR